MSKKTGLPIILVCVLLTTLFSIFPPSHSAIAETIMPPQNLAAAANAVEADLKSSSPAIKPAQAGAGPATIYLPAIQNSAGSTGSNTNLSKVSLTKGPDLIYTGSSTSMKLIWQWTANTSFRVDWGTTAAYGSSSAAVNASDTTNHMYSYTISGLNPGTLYQYRVVVGSKYSAGSFYTSPSESATELKFISYGDTRTNGAMHNTVAGKVMSLIQSDPAYQTVNPFVGDAVTDGGTESYWTNEFFDPKFTNIRTELASLAFLPVMGNHEGSGTLFKRYFAEPFVASRYWSVDYGPAHFIMLDQYTSYTSGSTQYNWLKSDLAATNKKWKIIVLHEPGWSAGGHGNNTTVQTVLEPLFEQYQVAMVLAGHNHYYARAVVNGIQHLTVGTGGAPAYYPESGQPNIVKSYMGYGFARFSISGNTLTGWFVDTNGATQDTFTINR